jgi:hypothetical protein
VVNHGSIDRSQRTTSRADRCDRIAMSLRSNELRLRVQDQAPILSLALQEHF